MNAKEFDEVVTDTIERCSNLLNAKAKEYATEDRLHNFKVASRLRGVTPKNALSGMMSKHTVSIYDMCENPQEYPMELWTEKICDSINYLFLLRALVKEGEV